MLRRAVLGSLLMGGLVATSAFGDALVLRGGKKIDTAGPWVTRGNIVTVHEITGRAQTLILSIIDFDATLKANLHNPPTTADQVHVDRTTVLALQTAAHNQVELSQRIREQAQADLLAQMTGSKPTRVGNSTLPGGPSASAQPFGKVGAPGNGFDAVSQCKVFQDNIQAYNHCLNTHGH